MASSLTCHLRQNSVILSLGISILSAHAYTSTGANIRALNTGSSALAFGMNESPLNDSHLYSCWANIIFYAAIAFSGF